MAEAKECDICGKLFKPNSIKVGDIGLYIVKNYGNSHIKEIDLCPSCQLELKKWFDSHKKPVL